MVAANYIAYTALINPPSATPQLTLEHIWSLLQRKVRFPQDFVGMAIESSEVLSTSTTASGLPVTTREVVFRANGRRVREECIEYRPVKVEYHMTDGSKVQNIISEGAEGELYMTYTFEWMHPELEGDEAALKEKCEKEKATAKLGVENTIKVMRQMVLDGRWKDRV
jgi:hypothetical protein